MVAIGVAYAAAIVSGGTAAWSAWVMATATSLAMVATMALGAARAGRKHGGLRRLAIPFAAVLLIMLSAFAAALLLPGTAEPLLLGLPRRAARDAWMSMATAYARPTQQCRQPLPRIWAAGSRPSPAQGR